MIPIPLIIGGVVLAGIAALRIRKVSSDNAAKAQAAAQVQQNVAVAANPVPQRAAPSPTLQNAAPQVVAAANQAAAVVSAQLQQQAAAEGRDAGSEVADELIAGLGES